MSQNPRSSFLRRLVSRVSPAGQSSSSSSTASGNEATQTGRTSQTTQGGLGGLSRSYNLKVPEVGPIIGTTGAYEIRIFLAAPQNEAREAVALGGQITAAAKLSTSSGETISPITTVMKPEFDYSGVIGFTGLTPDTEYRLKCGWYVVSAKDRGKEKEMLKGTLNFKNSAKTKFTTASINPREERSFVFGSCRYLLKFHTKKDLSLFDGRGDKTFRSILGQIREHGMKTDLCLMLGDQIYSDDLNVLHFDDEVQEFVARYRDAFSQPYLRQLMSSVPTSMILDDHEIQDNYPRNFDRKKRNTRLMSALHAYQIYQASHSTLFPIDKTNGSILGTPTKYWYTFSSGCSQWFIMDVRTERKISEDARGPNRIVSQEQMDALKEWLMDGAGTKVKFVATSVPVYPVVRTSKDKWSGFPRQKAELLEFIFENKIPKVCFLSGDIHNSVSMELQCDGHKIHSVVSSPFFWPIPTHFPSELIKSGNFKLMNGRVLSTVSTSKVIIESNFTRVNVAPKGITVKVYSRKGDLLDTSEYKFDDAQNEQT